MEAWHCQNFLEALHVPGQHLAERLLLLVRICGLFEQRQKHEISQKHIGTLDALLNEFGISLQEYESLTWTSNEFGIYFGGDLAMNPEWIPRNR